MLSPLLILLNFSVVMRGIVRPLRKGPCELHKLLGWVIDGK
jgi:hypothetical protein